MREEGDPSTLLPQEAACLADPAPQRLREFAAGRACARSALAAFGVRDFAVVMGAAREPLWPASLVGSITHTSGLCAAVVGEASRFAGLGLDVELAEAVKPALWRKICTPRELSWLKCEPLERQARAATLIFAVKEAFYKSQFPLVGEWLNFRDLNVEVQAPAGDYGLCAVHATRPIAVAAHAGLPLRAAYRFHEGYACAGVALPAANPGPAGAPQ